MTTTFEVHAELVGEMVTVSGPLPVRVSWSWSPAHPFTVALRFATGRAEAKDPVWVIARDLLVRGMGGSAGIGDVRVRPDTSEDTAGVWIELANDRQRAEFWFDKTQVLLFLSNTLARCPLGDEMSWVDLDQAITDLLDDPHGWRPGPGGVIA